MLIIFAQWTSEGERQQKRISRWERKVVGGRQTDRRVAMQFTFACAINSSHCCCCWPLLTLTAINAVDNWHAATVVDWPWEENKETRETSCSNCHCVLIAFTSCTAELPLSVSILSTTCASISPRSSGRELKLIWPKNAVFFRSCCAKSAELCFVFWWRRAIESDRLSALSLCPSLSL